MIKKKYNNDKLVLLQNAIKTNTNKLWYPDLNIQFEQLKTNSCFNINYHKTPVKYSNLDFNYDNKITDEPIMKCKIIDMHLNKKQKLILNCWFNAYIDMYNKTITFIKNTIPIDDFKKLKDLWINIKQHNILIKNNEKKLKNNINSKNKYVKKLKFLEINKKIKIRKNSLIQYQTLICTYKKEIKKLNIEKDMLDKQNIKMNIIFNNLNRKIDDNLNWTIIRTKNLKEIRDKIIERTYINHLGKKTQIKTHIIDTAIKMACTAYKSCKSNFMSGYIKKFRVKFWRYNKIRKILEIEAEYINKNKQICEQTLGKIKYTYKTDFFNKETQKYTKKIQKYILEEKTVKILYDKSSNKYQLLVAEDVDKIKTNITKFIGIDQGIRTFASCITNNEVIEIGTSIDELIKKYLLRIDKINNNDKIETIKKTIKCAKYMRKLKNKIEDIHWKTINYLTNNYKTIIIGDLSMKDASNNKTSKISNMTKRIGLMMSHFKFRQRLQYKCTIKGINLKIVDEWGTSKTCSFCGNFKAELKGEHIYECNVCKKHIGRDIGSSRNILFIGTRSNNI